MLGELVGCVSRGLANHNDKLQVHKIIIRDIYKIRVRRQIDLEVYFLLRSTGLRVGPAYGERQRRIIQRRYEGKTDIHLAIVNPLGVSYEEPIPGANLGSRPFHFDL